MNPHLDVFGAVVGGLGFSSPALLLLVLLVPVALLARARRRAPAVVFAPPVRGLPGSPRTRLRAVLAAVEFLGLVLLVVALARPIDRVRLPLEVEGIDIILCMDVSSSMASTDMDPNRSRLEIAKEAAERFVAGRDSDRVGLISFAGFPDVLCPLTLDHRAVAELLAGLELVEEDGPEDLTGIGTALAKAAQALRASDAASKVVVLLTDGEENVARADTPDEIGPLSAARLCREFDVRVSTIVAGVGRPGPGGAWLPLDRTQVKAVAESTGGGFYEATDAAAMASVYATIDAMERARFADPRYEVEERFLPILIAGLALLLSSRLLRATRLEVWP